MQDDADADAAYKAVKVQAAAANANAAAMQGPGAAQPARQAAPGGAPAASTFQGEPLRIHVTLSDDVTTGQQSPRRTVSVPGKEQAAEAAPEAPIRALPVKSSLAGSSIEGSKPRWMPCANERGGPSLQHPALCTTVSLHARCGLQSAPLLRGPVSVCRAMRRDAAVRSRSGPARVKVECSCCWRQESELASMSMHVLLLTQLKPQILPF